MILVDTSVWIEFFKKNSPYFEELGELIESGNVITHSLIFAELLQGCKTRNEKDLILEYWENLSDEESNSGIINGGIFSFQKNFYSKGIGLIDAVLIHETRRRNSKIWTLDKKILSHIPKSEQFFI